MKMLTDEEKSYYEDLENNFEKHVEQYKEEISKLDRDKLKKEIYRLEKYLELYDQGEVSDMMINIKLIRAKIKCLNIIVNPT